MTVQYIYKTVIDQNHVGREGNSAVSLADLTSIYEALAAWSAIAWTF